MFKMRTGRSRIHLRRGRRPTAGGKTSIQVCQIFQKLHEIKKNLGAGEGAPTSAIHVHFAGGYCLFEPGLLINTH